MDLGIISVRYAKALLKFASEKGEVRNVYQSMQTLTESFQTIPSLRQTLENPIVDNDRKLHILTLAAGKDICESLRQFFLLVLKNRRVTMIQFIAHSFIDSYRKQNHLINCELTVPVSLDDVQLNRLKKLVNEKTNNEVEFIVNVDPSIIGGFVMEYDSTCLDASIAGRLKNIKKSLLNDDKFLISNHG